MKDNLANVHDSQHRRPEKIAQGPSIKKLLKFSKLKLYNNSGDLTGEIINRP